VFINKINHFFLKMEWLLKNLSLLPEHELIDIIDSKYLQRISQMPQIPIWPYVLSFCDIRDTFAIMLTCTEWYKATHSNTFWMQKMIRKLKLIVPVMYFPLVVLYFNPFIHETLEENVGWLWRNDVPIYDDCCIVYSHKGCWHTFKMLTDSCTMRIDGKVTIELMKKTGVIRKYHRTGIIHYTCPLTLAEYIGPHLDDLPHGSGGKWKFVDGSIYEGPTFAGKPHDEIEFFAGKRLKL